jgi:hypothetical protein
MSARPGITTFSPKFLTSAFAHWRTGGSREEAPLALVPAQFRRGAGSRKAGVLVWKGAVLSREEIRLAFGGGHFELIIGPLRYINLLRAKVLFPMTGGCYR